MSMQSQNTAPSRNPSAAAGIPTKVSVGKGVKAPNTASSVSTGSGPSSGTSIKGFGGSKAPSVPVGNSGPSTGSGVKGFSGGGLIPGKV